MFIHNSTRLHRIVDGVLKFKLSLTEIKFPTNALWVKWVFNAPTGMIQQLYHWRRDFIAEYIVFVIKQKEKKYDFMW